VTRSQWRGPRRHHTGFPNTTANWILRLPHHRLQACTASQMNRKRCVTIDESESRT
jgi:hypothetical protein